MTTQAYTIEEFDLRSADDTAYRKVWELSELLRQERRPEDPPRPFDSYVARERNIPDFVRLERVLARRNDGELAALADFVIDLSGTNAHMAQFEIHVAAPDRRHGIARSLLPWGIERARAYDRRMLLFSTSSRIEAGAIFAERIGAQRGLENRISQLDLGELDRELLRRWQERAAERAADYELLSWDDMIPADQIERYATLCEVMNSAPREGLDVEDEKITPEKLRSWLASMRASNTHVWWLVARERTSGDLVGFTELFHTPARPTILDQGATAVHAQARNRGLGRWLKAAMLDRVLRELPQAQIVRTGNAQSNAPMLAINVELGFKPYEASTIWQVDIDSVASYLKH